jgi:hypothetical protein
MNTNETTSDPVAAALFAFRSSGGKANWRSFRKAARERGENAEHALSREMSRRRSESAKRQRDARRAIQEQQDETIG